MRDVGKEIEQKLDEIERQENVRILHAVESGSRAWGFPSPDSDYDVRLVYVRPASDYLSIEEPRDVIEWQLDEVLDVNGWDLKKALRQFAKGNAALFEWSGSPIVYRTSSEWEAIRKVSQAYFSEKAAIGHYCGMALNTLKNFLSGDAVRYKKYFYALRPILAARFVEEFHTAPPVLFSELMKLDFGQDVKAAVEELLVIKKGLSEKDERPQIPVIHSFIERETERLKDLVERQPDDHNGDLTSLNELFRKICGNQE